MRPTLYDILGVPEDATRDQIKSAWRDAADRFEPGSGGSTTQFRLFNEAAEVLLDPERREAYDDELAASQPVPAPEAPTTPPAPATGTVPAAGMAPDGDAEDRRRGVPLLAVVLLGVLAAALAGVAGYLGVQAQRTQAYADALEQAPAAAERAAAAILSYDHESLEADRDAAARFMTSDYRDDYVKTFDSLVTDAARETKAEVTAEVRASSAMVQAADRQNPDRVPVLLFVNQVTESTANDQPTVALNRVRLTMVHVNDTWLVDDITSY